MLNFLDSRFRGNDTVTTFDLIKTFAVIIMIIDHIGFYFLTPPLGAEMGDPHLWWRAVGRWCVPIWFFLIGYGRSQTVSFSLITGAVMLTVMNIVTGMFLFPLNVLVSMIIIRLSISHIVQFTFSSQGGIGISAILIGIGYFITNDIFEYGTLGVLIAIMGYLVREYRDQTNFITNLDMTKLKIGAIFGVGAVIFCQNASFNFDGWQSAVMSGGIIIVFAVLFTLRPTKYPLLSQKLPSIIQCSIHVLGRRTLEIYVIHLTLFKIAALVFGLGYPIYGWFDWDWTIYGAFQNANH